MVIPDNPHPDGKWMLKTEYFGAFPELELELLRRGLYLGYVPNITRWSTDEDQDIKSEFINYIAGSYGLKNKCLLIGMSCGGLHAAELAARHPMSELICSRNHPIDKLDILLGHELPVYMVYGDKDDTVPYCENGAVLEKFYHEHGGTLITECKQGVNHHPHGPRDIKTAASILEKWA